jgi:hypothetical protein
MRDQPQVCRHFRNGRKHAPEVRLAVADEARQRRQPQAPSRHHRKRVDDDSWMGTTQTRHNWDNYIKQRFRGCDSHDTAGPDVLPRQTAFKRVKVGEETAGGSYSLLARRGCRVAGSVAVEKTNAEAPFQSAKTTPRTGVVRVKAPGCSGQRSCFADRDQAPEGRRGKRSALSRSFDF